MKHRDWDIPFETEIMNIVNDNHKEKKKQNKNNSKGKIISFFKDKKNKGDK